MAAKKEVTEKAVEKIEDTKPVVNTSEDIKYRCDFNSYEEYNNYKGKKG